ncbi:prevent-host-death family protein [Streptomyces drozdowiczii]|uniref:Prevent-host-death family protein n=1 Tax=Streptomyces drozdowiczii TaxID=202862 RepID=A0ABY6PU17_9ACTN|nr:prevent-host-death family protein [Streptomyces drozdowiczii]MCX0244433.1 prevent-host-death family protein [Streptomyces drozdowiczii]UZK55794.1 prevent-host-death family protein [Streptomyces drozdowiczii]
MSDDQQERTDPEEARALADYRARRASAVDLTEPVPHDEVRARLGLERR